MADLYTATYTDVYGAGTGTPGGAITLTVTAITGRPTNQMLLENADSVPHILSVTRSRGVAGQRAVRWATEVTIQPGASHAFIDDEAPIGATFTYSVFSDGVLNQESAEVLFSGPWMVDNEPTYAWLRHLSLPALSVPIIIEGLEEIQREAVYGEFTPLWAGKPVVTQAPRGSRSGTLSLLTLTNTGADQLEDILDDSTPVQLATDPQYNVRDGGMYLAIPNMTQGRWHDDGISPERTFDLKFIEVDAPPVTTEQGSLKTYAELLAAYVTYAALLADATANGWKYRDLL